MEVSANLNKFSKAHVIRNLENELEFLKNNNIENEKKNDEIKNTIEESIQNYYKKEADAAIIRFRVKWLEEDEKSTRYFFNLKRNVDKINYGIKSKQRYRYDIDSIIDEQVKFYSDLLILLLTNR